MSAIQIHVTRESLQRGRLVAILGDVLDLTEIAIPSYPFTVRSAPDGSVATFSGARITPDVAGPYTFTATSGSGKDAQDFLVAPCFVFTTAIRDSLVASTVPPLSDAERRSILVAFGSHTSVSTATLTAWNAGRFPPGEDGFMRRHGGR